MNTEISVLVVDGSPATANIVSTLVRQCGFAKVDQALSGQSALEALRNERYRLVIADINMVGMNGVELLAAVRSDFFLANVCFVLMSAERHPQLVEAAIRYRADCFVTKPFTRDILKCKLEDLPKLKAA